MLVEGSAAWLNGAQSRCDLAQLNNAPKAAICNLNPHVCLGSGATFVSGCNCQLPLCLCVHVPVCTHTYRVQRKREQVGAESTRTSPLCLVCGEDLDSGLHGRQTALCKSKVKSGFDWTTWILWLVVFGLEFLLDFLVFLLFLVCVCISSNELNNLCFLKTKTKS